MARYGFRSGRRSGSSQRGASGSANRSRRRGSSGKAKPKSSKSGVVAYSLYDLDGKRTYVGSTNNPKRRASQHADTGKLENGGKMVVESKPMSRKAAERLEVQKVQGYRRRTGKLPKHNKTGDGQYHHRKFD